LACSTIASFSASAPASVPAGGIADECGVPDASESETPGKVGSSELGCLVSSDIYGRKADYSKGLFILSEFMKNTQPDFRIG
jgi:hypothetical protein